MGSGAGPAVRFLHGRGAGGGGQVPATGQPEFREPIDGWWHQGPGRDADGILNAGGLTKGGFNFDAKIRRQSTDPVDLFHGHIGGIDTLAKGLLVAADLIETQALTGPLGERYADWNGSLGKRILGGQIDLAGLGDQVLGSGMEPLPRSGRQEALENAVSRAL